MSRERSLKENSRRKQDSIFNNLDRMEQIQESILKRIQSSIQNSAQALDQQSDRRLLGRFSETDQMGVVDPIRRRPMLKPSPPLEPRRQKLTSHCRVRISNVAVVQESSPFGSQIPSIRLSTQRKICSSMSNFFDLDVDAPLLRYHSPERQGQHVQAEIAAQNVKPMSFSRHVPPRPPTPVNLVCHMRQKKVYYEPGSKIPKWEGFSTQRKKVSEFIRKQEEERKRKLKRLKLVYDGAERKAKFLLAKLHHDCQRTIMEEEMQLAKSLELYISHAFVPPPASAKLGRQYLTYVTPGSKVPTLKSHFRQRKAEEACVESAAVSSATNKAAVRQRSVAQGHAGPADKYAPSPVPVWQKEEAKAPVRPMAAPKAQLSEGMRDAGDFYPDQ
ncbi:uncharacterized protein [Hoplias malabaricus]|uniref:uncharacterized protein n=1 Tax=Hoplias malabaricus TaxID=27720 RepID=UPI003461D0B7